MGFPDHSRPASPPPGLQCAWLDELPAPPRPTRLQGDVEFDHAVLGAGFAGLAAARRLAELQPRARIALIEAARVGDGATGRNSGLIIDLPHKFAVEQARFDSLHRLTRLNRMAIDALRSLVRRHRIACDWSETGRFHGAVAGPGLDHLRRYVQVMHELGEPCRWVERDELQSILGTAHYAAATHTPGGVLIQPAALVRGLALHLPAGIELFEASPVRSVRRSTGGVELTGDGFRARAHSLLVTAGAYAREFDIPGPGRVLPLMTFASITEPLAERQAGTCTMRRGWGLTPADPAGTTLRMLHDGRLLVRRQYRYVPRYGREVSRQDVERIRADHLASLRRRYPGMASIALTHTWGGIYGVSRNFKNYFGNPAPGVHALACDNGVGVAWGTVAGGLLAEAALGVESQALEDLKAVSGVPPMNLPEALMRPAMRARIAWSAWRSRAER